MPRRADGTWEDKDGNVVYRTDPHDTGVDHSRATYQDGFWIDNATGQKIPNKNDLPTNIWVSDGPAGQGHRENTWPDGTPVTQEQAAEINNQGSASPTGPGWLDILGGIMTGGIGTVISGTQGQWLGNPPGVATGHEPSEGAPDYGITGFADPSGYTNNLIPANAPGAELPTTQADEDRQRMADYLAKLQGQAATGSGAWEQQLAASTQQGTAAASALGQSSAGLDPMAMRRNIGNATAGVQQRAAGQAETLRAQTQQQAQQELADINSAQGSLDAQQAAEQAAARQARAEANKAITDEANRVNANTYNGYAQAMGTVASMGGGKMSDGGPVPGKARVFGDDSSNDTVPAMLSPGEIVLPRSVTQSGDPEAAAAAFVQAVKEHHGRHFDGGGKVPPPDPWATKPDTNASDALPVLADDPTAPGGSSTGQGYVFGINTPQQAAGVRNGGLLDTTAYNASRDATLGSTQAFLDAFGGRGPSVAPQAMQNATDANLAEAMSAQANARGAGRGAAAGMISGKAGEGQSEAAGKAASTAANEATRGGQSYAAAIQRQRQMDLAFALAQQQAAWRNSMINAGIGIQNQATLRNVLSGAGQAFASGAGALENRLKALDSGANANLGSSGEDPWSADATPSEQGDWGGYDSGDTGGGSDSGGDSPSWASDSGTAYAAHGGEIRERDKAFTRACGFADGGDVPYPGYRGMVGEGETPEQAAARLGGVYSPFGARTPPGYRGVAQPGESPTDAAARLGGAPGPMEDEAGANALVAQYLGGASSSPPGMVAQMAPGAAMPVPGGSEVVPEPVPVPVPTPRVRTGNQSQAPARPDNYALEQQAATDTAAAHEEAGRAQAEALVGAQKALETAAIDQKESRARAQIAADADMARILEARQAVASSSSTIDPGRWWASRSTPGKIAAAIGLALGAIGAGNDGVNRAVGIIQNAIGRDLEAQKAEHEIRLRKGQLAVDSATSIYTLHRQLARDDIASADASKATALEIAKNQVDLATARASSPLAKAQGQMLAAQLGQKRDEHDAATAQRSYDNWIKREDVETRRIAALKERASQIGRDFVAPGYKLQPGAAPKVEELGKWRDALAEKRNTDVATRKLKELIDKSSFTPGGSDAAQAQSLISDLKVSYKNMATLGALSGSDYALIDAAIPDPTSFKGHFTPDKTLKSRLDQFAKTADNKLQNKASVLGIVPAEEASTGSTNQGQVAEAKAWLDANPNSPKAAAVRAKLQQMGAM